MSTTIHPLPDPKGHVALVTGANHGIGAAVAELLASAGCNVLATYLRVAENSVGPDIDYAVNRQQNADTTIDRIKSKGGNAVAIEADLSNESIIGDLFDSAESSFGPVDILVNNASAWLADTFTGIETDKLGRGVQRVSATTLDSQFEVDARASALLIAEFASRCQRHGLSWGRIVGLTSGGPLGFPGQVSYGAAKAAMENYTMSAALELAHLGITANVVHPPVTDTGWVDLDVRKMVEEDPLLVHVAQPSEVAEVIGWLVSEEAMLVTGNVIHLR